MLPILCPRTPLHFGHIPAHHPPASPLLFLSTFVFQPLSSLVRPRFPSCVSSLPPPTHRLHLDRRINTPPPPRLNRLDQKST
jgi:hypothetical protein